MFVLSVGIASLALVASAFVFASPQDIISKAIDALGGEDALKALEGLSSHA